MVCTEKEHGKIDNLFDYKQTPNELDTTFAENLP